MGEEWGEEGWEGEVEGEEWWEEEGRVLGVLVLGVLGDEYLGNLIWWVLKAWCSLGIDMRCCGWVARIAVEGQGGI